MIAAVAMIASLFAAMAGLPLFAQATTRPTAQSTAPATRPATATTSTADVPAAVVVLNTDIDDYSRDMLFKRFAAAKAGGAKTIILQLTTPGGLVTSALDISRFLRTQDDVRTIAFVEGRALSAGIMIGLACDELVMAPHSQIGDSAPIALRSDGSLHPLGDAERAKAESPILADFYASATRNGYDPLLTDAMVAVKRVVHFVQSPDAAEKRLVDEPEYDKLRAAGWTPVPGVPNPLDRNDTLLTVGSNVAEKIGLSKGTFNSPQAFAQARGLSIGQTYAPVAGDRIIDWLTSPVLRTLLIIVMLQSMWIALGHPGHGWPEAISVACLAALVAVPMLTGYASWLEVTAILIGLVLLAVEIFVLPGFGAAGVLGLVLLLGGLVMTFVGDEPAIPGILPSLKGTWAALQRGVMTVTAALAVSLVGWLWLSRYLRSLPYFNRLILSTVAGDIDATNLDRPLETGPAVGDTGVAVTDLKPGGSVKFLTESYPNGRIASVVSDSGYVRNGTPVIVTNVGGNRVVVRADV